MNLSENSRQKYFVPVESQILFPVCLGVLFCALVLRIYVYSRVMHLLQLIALLRT